jgi:hypothetical protein
MDNKMKLKKETMNESSNTADFTQQLLMNNNEYNRLDSTLGISESKNEVMTMLKKQVMNSYAHKAHLLREEERAKHMQNTVGGLNIEPFERKFQAKHNIICERCKKHSNELYGSVKRDLTCRECLEKTGGITAKKAFLEHEHNIKRVEQQDDEYYDEAKEVLRSAIEAAYKLDSDNGETIFRKSLGEHAKKYNKTINRWKKIELFDEDDSIKPDIDSLTMVLGYYFWNEHDDAKITELLKDNIIYHLAQIKNEHFSHITNNHKSFKPSELLEIFKSFEQIKKHLETSGEFINTIIPIEV